MDKKDAEYDFEDLIKIENEFIYKMRTNDRPSGKVYMILNNGEKKEEDKDWTKKLYPKIKNMDEESQSRLMVDKITYKED